MKTAYLILGAIGSGKSVVAEILLSSRRFQGVEFVSSDMYKAKFFNVPDGGDKRGYRGADELVFYRIIEICKTGNDFVYEFCPTNLNKIEAIKNILRKYAYDAVGFFVGTEKSAINLDRCKRRQLAGADVVPEDKINGRYRDAMCHVMDLVEISTKMYFIDNSMDCLTIVASCSSDVLEVTNSNCNWFNNNIRQRININ